MGLFDNLKNVLGGKKDDSIAGTTKAPSQVLRENGIDPGGLKFSFGADGTVTVKGHVQNEADKARIKQLLSGIPGIKKVEQDLSLKPAAPAVEKKDDKPKAAPAAEATTRTAEAESADSSEATTYTVKSGDTLWKIAKEFYGEGAKYTKIFEANRNILENPDHILPGQELTIPK